MDDLPPKPEWLNRVAIIGVGLLGGSVGHALRRRGVQVVGYSRRESTAQTAVRSGAIDEGHTTIGEACRGADVVVICSPVDKIATLAAQACEVLDDQTLITDVGSTKALIVDEIESKSTRAFRQFVAAHPIAGSEKTGVENAMPDLFDGKCVILTPNERTDATMLARAKQFWRQTGGSLVLMSPAEHDERLAAVSHVPHLISSLLATFPDDPSLPLVGSGWRDMTRVAAGDPEMWTAICNHNRPAILSQLDRFIEELKLVKTRLSDENVEVMYRWLARAKERKQSTESG
ncbi:prephenate dehydrogenase [Roseiconus lacunae]|uniref:prephenate dehydrogenase n=1 Tax=Roseiconus lacunae TaxID=2605694 RepID=UPI0011F2D172|nr:prephenate dehydrogenase/arogenate dehydrogenase family protein [Roseiconus lacunae]